MTELDNIKPGDKVLFHAGYGDVYIKTIDRVTPTQIIINNVNYWKKNGSRVGASDRWTSTSVDAATPENLQHFAKAIESTQCKALASFLRNFEWSLLPLDELRQIKRMVTKQEQGEPQ